MIKFLYVPPFAGSNFLAKHLLWSNFPKDIGGGKPIYQNSINEYIIERELADTPSNSAKEHVMMYLVGKKDKFEEQTKDIAEVHNVKILKDHFYELPFWDFPMFGHECLRLENEWLNTFFKKSLKLFIKIYSEENLKCKRITHFHFSRYIPDFEHGDYCSHLNILLDDESLELCYKLSAHKHKQSLLSKGNALQCNATLKNVTDTLQYSKLFFDLDEEEIYKLFDYFDNTSYFKNNKDLIIEDFRNYTKKNFELIQ